ncbi:hypothetical protein EJU97_04685, partial [Campylobacter upsaliensis]|nr:hypothetical protein [Campylobacter upsaliensis]
MRQIYPNLPQDDYEINVLIRNKPHTREAKNIFSLNYLVDNRTPKDPNINFNISFQTRKIKSPKEKK